MLESDDLEVRQNCARLLSFDSSAEFGREKATALIKSIDTVRRSPRADEAVAYSHEYGTPWTMAGLVYEDIIRTLGGAKSVNLQLLQELTPETPGLPRDCVLIARAWRHDATVRPELHRIMRESPAGKVRFAAVGVFLMPDYGRLEDVPDLEKVAASDPLSATLAAGQSIPAGREDWLQPGQRPPEAYPIRHQARRAIELIQRQVAQ